MVENNMSNQTTVSKFNGILDNVKYDQQDESASTVFKQEREKLYFQIYQLSDPNTRETAMFELNKRRENTPELAPLMWFSFGTIAALLQEIISI